MPMKDTAFDAVFLEMLEEGHCCKRCIRFDDRGTIFCIRRGSFCVATVANVRSTEFHEQFPHEIEKATDN